MSYKPQPNQRKHKRLIADAIAEAELAEQDLAKLKDIANNDATKAFILGIQVRVLTVNKHLREMMEIARLESNDE